ncbi:LppX_LprAFG lipoprotein [Nocardioides sp. cx-169]|uniref:LppX_LprAFG lipoprotein n=1 Tax=Nocardioides sp. cx-169 TaxID=2899080 RepID=UPI001E3F6A8A|nr:LppX_LprAFG lipoprotein [Nocardioides sp. cx-169]MCD4534867.1 LppX_LprAFG lipoprotein [Nocardioides sp. cx-169]
MRSRLAALAVPALLLALSACGADSDEGGSEDRPPEEVLASAKAELDDTAGVMITLETSDLPDGVTGILAAEGVGTHAPAFDGTIDVSISAGQFQVPVIAVDGKVYAEIPLSPGMQEVDPGEYGAPDPAQLMSPDKGFSSLLPATEALEKGESIRGGEGNKEIFTEYSGTVPGTVVKNVIPGSTGDFDVTYTVSDSGELRSAVLTGAFYQGADSMTYTLTFDDYGTEKDITAP